MEQSTVISEKEAKKLVEKYLTGQIKRIIEMTVLVESGESWEVGFSGLPAEKFTITKDGEIIFEDRGHSSSMTNV